MLHKCHERKVIQFVNYKLQSDPENYFREKLLLYTPWQNEDTDLLHGCSTYEDAFKLCQHMIIEKMKTYELFDISIEEAISTYNIENAHDNNIAQSADHDNDDPEIGAPEGFDQYAYLNPARPSEHTDIDIRPQLNINTHTFEDSVEMIDDIMDDNSY